MGMYFSTSIKCNVCKNHNTFNTSCGLTEELQYIKDNDRPRIVCGRCGAEDITISDQYFCSTDMSQDEGSTKYEPNNPNLTWVLQDCQQRLPDVIYIRPEYVFQHESLLGKRGGILLSFQNFKNYTTEPSSTKSQTIVPFRRVKQLSLTDDLYIGATEEYQEYEFYVTYKDIPNEDKPSEAD